MAKTANLRARLRKVSILRLLLIRKLFAVILIIKDRD